MSIAPEYFAEIEDIYNVIKKQNCKTVAFTSSQGKEGVTEVILVTAKRFAKMNKKVLIVDMNSFQPRLSQDKRATWRIADFASQEQSCCSLSENIDLLPFPIGTNEPDVAFRAESKFRSMLEHLGKRFDVVMFDTCPLIRINAANVSAQFIASCCDGNFIIVTPGITKESSLLKSINMLSACSVTNLGIIVNDFASPSLTIQITRTISQRLGFIPRIQAWLLKRVASIELLTGKYGR